MAEEPKERKAFEAHMRVGGHSNHDKHPDGSYVSSAMELWWQGWKARAQLPSQGGEAVEVVGVVCVSRFKNNPAMENVEFHQSADIPPGQHDLMTVAQHQRIMAASAKKTGEAVATDAFVPGSLADLLFQLGEKGIGVSGGTHGDHWRVSPLYTHPADQVEDDLTMVKVPRELANRLTSTDNHVRQTARRELRNLLLNGGRS